MSEITIPVGEHVLGRVLNVSGDPIDGLGPISDAPRLPINSLAPSTIDRATSEQILETGIKVIDLIAPLPRGGRIGLYGPVKAGKLVVLGELIHHVATHHHGYAVLVGLEERTYEVNDLLRVLRELGVADKTALVFGQVHEPLTVCQRAVLAGLTIAEHFRSHGREGLFFIDKKLALTSDMESWQSRIGTTKNGAISLMFFGPADDETDPENVSLSGHLDGQLVFDRSLVEQGILPAIDPLVSTSHLLESRVVGDEHLQIARQVQQILQRARDVHAMRETQGTASLSEEDHQVIARARRIWRFLTQPFYVAELYTTIPGEYVSRKDTLKGFRSLVEGQYDNLPEKAFYMIGSIDQAIEKAKHLQV